MEGGLHTYTLLLDFAPRQPCVPDVLLGNAVLLLRAVERAKVAQATLAGVPVGMTTSVNSTPASPCSPSPPASPSLTAHQSPPGSPRARPKTKSLAEGIRKDSFQKPRRAWLDMDGHLPRGHDGNGAGTDGVRGGSEDMHGFGEIRVSPRQAFDQVMDVVACGWAGARAFFHARHVIMCTRT